MMSMLCANSSMRWYYYLIYFLVTIGMGLGATDTAKMDPKLKDRLTAMIADCQKTAHASEADMAAIREKRMPTSHEGQCLVECVFSATKIMSNGNLDKDNALKVLTPHLKGDMEKTKKLEQMLETCDKEIGKTNDKCTTAKKVVECTQKYGKEFGFQMPIHV